MLLRTETVLAPFVFDKGLSSPDIETEMSLKLTGNVRGWCSVARSFRGSLCFIKFIVLKTVTLQSIVTLIDGTRINCYLEEE